MARRAPGFGVTRARRHGGPCGGVPLAWQGRAQVVGTVIEAELPGVAVGELAEVGPTLAEVIVPWPYCVADAARVARGCLSCRRPVRSTCSASPSARVCWVAWSIRLASR